ncbi:MAG: WYL domain-containing protein [Magnetococcales bacterium]|nr:WYL domain-containing protein [Magnetococcales bacterium]
MPPRTTRDKAKAIQLLRWGVERRMEFIEFRLFWEGRINRRDLIEKFGVSTPQASADMSQYQDIAPGNLHYDPRAKYYYPDKEFKPRFLNPDSDRYLANLLSMAAGILTSEESWLDSVPAYDVLPQPRRGIDPERLRRVVGAIRERLAIQVRYQSMNSPDPEWRWITPHSLGFDGYRWHARAFCHRSETFKDFVLSRIVSIRLTKPHEVNPEQDHEWQEMVDVKIGPHPGLTESQRKAIELDYGMKDGHMTVQVRRGFLYYFLKRFGLDIDPSARAPKDQQIILLNENRLLSCMPEPAEISRGTPNA